VDDESMMGRLFYLFNQEYTWPSINEPEELALYTSEARTVLRGRAYDSFCMEISNYLGYRPDIRSELFYIFNHCRRLTQNLVVFTRSHIEVRCPFFDIDLFDFLFSLPAEIRGHQVLYRAMIGKELPRLSRIPYDHDGFLPTGRKWLRESHALAVRFKRRVNKHLFPIFKEPSTLYFDYETHLRDELQTWARGILLDKRVEDRSIFNVHTLKSLLDRQRAGREVPMIGKIAPLITYEMMLRKLYD
jgi:asparagine synthase (glutamine-hydrolysing)